MRLQTKFFTYLFLITISILSSAQNTISIYVNPAIGNDSNSGTKELPLKSLAGASKLVNSNEGNDAITIYLSSGVYAVNESAKFLPTKRSFTK